MSDRECGAILSRLLKSEEAAIASRMEVVRRLLAHWFAGLSEPTRRSYLHDLQLWGARQRCSPAMAAYRLLAGGMALAAEDVSRWREEMRVQGLSVATISRRLATLRSLVRAAAELGMVSWSLATRNPRRAKSHLVRGVPWRDVETCLARLGQASDELAARDRTFILLLYDSGLRASEVLSVEARGVNVRRRTVRVIRKGSTERVMWPISKRTASALADFLAGRKRGSLFEGRDGRLGYGAAYRLVRRRGVQCGFEGWHPHAMRHAAVGKVLELTGNAEMARQFGAHSNIGTTQLYFSQITNLATQAVAIVAGEQK